MKKITFSIASPFSGAEVRELLTYVFQISLFSFVALYILESIVPGFVSLFFNMYIFLWITVCFGILSKIWPTITLETDTIQPQKRDILRISLLAFASGFLVWHKLGATTLVLKVLAILSGLIVFGLCLIVYFDKEK